MSTSHWFELVVAGIALLVLALSSWVEISLSSASRINLRRLLDERFAKSDEQALERNQRVRAGMMLIALLSGALSAVLITHVFDAAIDDYGWISALAISGVLLVLFGRIWPRAAAGREPDAESPMVTRVAAVLLFVFAPIVQPVVALSDRLARGRRRHDTSELLAAGGEENGSGNGSSEREADEGSIEEDEQEMISGVLHLDTATARDIMVPRIDIVAVASDVLVSEAVDVAIQAGHSRIPVYARSIDEIIGVAYAKDMLRFVNEDHEGVVVGSLIRDAYFVPESKRVDDLLSDLQAAKVHLAVVVDEYGGTAGVVTIEDILEEIVGEIQDEYDREQPRLEIISPDEAISDGTLNVDDLADDFDLVWPEPVSGTVGGLIQRRLGRIPTEGEVVEMDGLRLTVLQVERRRVRQVRIERIRVDSSAEPEARPVAVDAMVK